MLWGALKNSGIVRTQGRLAAGLMLQLIFLDAGADVKGAAGGQDTRQQSLVQVHVEVEGPQQGGGGRAVCSGSAASRELRLRPLVGVGMVKQRHSD